MTRPGFVPATRPGFGAATRPGFGAAACPFGLPRLIVAGGGALLATLLTGVGCARPIVVDAGPRAYYQTANPLRDTSTQLERILEAVKRIHVSAEYLTYVFSYDDAPSAGDPLTEDVLARALDTVTSDLDRAASAVVLSARGSSVLLLTAWHAVNTPDTLVHYFVDAAGQRGRDGPRRVRSVSVLERINRWVEGLPSTRPFDLLAEDRPNDLALIGLRHSDNRSAEHVALLPVPAGRSNRLSWGSFVYAIGYPTGYPMVTRGIVSNPGGPGSRTFVIDGLWNEGMSGGLVLAVRGEDEQLEWVGMARASAGSTEYVLAPPEAAEQSHDDWRPYEGPIFIQQVRRIQYGITFAVPIDLVRRFVDEHRGELRARAYEVPRL